MEEARQGSRHRGLPKGLDEINSAFLKPKNPIGVNQYIPSTGVKRDTNLMSHPDSPLLDNPYGSTASPEEQSLVRLGRRRSS